MINESNIKIVKASILTVTLVILAAVMLIIHKHRFFAIFTGDVLQWRAFKWDNFNNVVFYAPRHGAVTQDEGLICLVIMKNEQGLERLIHAKSQCSLCCFLGNLNGIMDSLKSTFLLLKKNHTTYI